MENKITTFENICRWAQENKRVYIYEEKINRCLSVKFLSINFLNNYVYYVYSDESDIKRCAHVHHFGLNSVDAKTSYIAYERAQMKLREETLCAMEKTE